MPNLAYGIVIEGFIDNIPFEIFAVSRECNNTIILALIVAPNFARNNLINEVLH